MPADPRLSQMGTLVDIRIDQIDRNPRQPRQRVDQEALVGLATSLQESGVIEPLIVQAGGRAVTSWWRGSGGGGPRR